MKTIFASMLVAAGVMAIRLAPEDMQTAQDLGSQYVDSKAEALDILKNASKEQAMEFCSNPDNKKICGFAKKMAKKHGITEEDVAAWQANQLAQIDEDDLPSKQEIMDELKEHGLTKKDVKGWCKSVMEDSEALTSDEELCGALAKIAKKGKKGEKLAQVADVDADLQKAREHGSKFFKSEAEAIKTLKNATKEQAMEFCGNPENEKVCDFVMKMAKKHDITEDDVAAWQANQLAQIDEDDLPSKQEIMDELKERDLTKKDVKQWCKSVMEDSEAETDDEMLCGALAKIAKKGKKGEKGEKLAQQTEGTDSGTGTESDSEDGPEDGSDSGADCMELVKEAKKGEREAKKGEREAEESEREAKKGEREAEESEREAKKVAKKAKKAMKESDWESDGEVSMGF